MAHGAGWETAAFPPLPPKAPAWSPLDHKLEVFTDPSMPRGRTHKAWSPAGTRVTPPLYTADTSVSSEMTVWVMTAAAQELNGSGHSCVGQGKCARGDAGRLLCLGPSRQGRGTGRGSRGLTQPAPHYTERHQSRQTQWGLPRNAGLLPPWESLHLTQVRALLEHWGRGGEGPSGVLRGTWREPAKAHAALQGGPPLQSLEGAQQLSPAVVKSRRFPHSPSRQSCRGTPSPGSKKKEKENCPCL